MNLDRDDQYFLELQTQTGWGRMLASFARWCAPKPGQRILDIGCGPGLLPALFEKAGGRAFGIDHDIGMLSGALHPGVIAAKASCLPFASSTFDLVTASNILYLTPDPLPILHEMMRVLYPGGRICLLNPSEEMNVPAATALAAERGLEGLARESLLNYAQRAEDNHRWTSTDLQGLFTQIGLELTSTTVRMGNGLVRYVMGLK